MKLLLVSPLLLHATLTQAFVSQSLRSVPHTALKYSLRNDDERSRIKALEELMDDHQGLEESFLYDPERTALTSVARRSRELELGLMDTLKDSDEAIDELVHLWVYQNGQDYGQRLEAMQSQCSPGLVEEVRDLEWLIQEFPTWAEPWSRIACVHFVQGQLHRAFHACQKALAIKPWHPEVYQLLVRIALRQRDRAQAIYWARQGLPLKPHSKRRQRWVAGAVADAKKRLQQDEEYTARITVARKIRSESLMETQGILENDCETDEDDGDYPPDDEADECQVTWE